MRSKLTLIFLVSITIFIVFVLYEFNNKYYDFSGEKSQYLLGVNIHFVEPNVEEVKKIREAGIKIVRMDLLWSDIEKQRGIYDFSKYDKLVKSMNENNIKILFILDYANPLYDNNLSPYSNDGRRAFANFAKQAVGHYKNKQIIWEIWNEPNVAFWKPMSNSNNYFKLVMDTIYAIKSKDRNAYIIALALAKFDYVYLNSLGRLGLFNYINAISVHPYREENPETVIEDYKKMRVLIRGYNHNRNMGIISGEWGYSTSWAGMNDIKQAQYCIREYLINIMSGVNISIWYDWKNDGTNKNDSQHNFGTVNNNLTPKPTYYAIKTMNTTIDGYRYLRRIDTISNSDYVLLFKRGKKVIYVLWTTNRSHNVSINLKGNIVKVIELMGNSYKIKASDKKYNINIDNSVKYYLN